MEECKVAGSATLQKNYFSMSVFLVFYIVNMVPNHNKASHLKICYVSKYVYFHYFHFISINFFWSELNFPMVNFGSLLTEHPLFIQCLSVHLNSMFDCVVTRSLVTRLGH